MISNTDSCCPKSHYFSNNTAPKMQIQGTTAKNSYPEKPKATEIKPTLSQIIEAGKLFMQICKKKKEEASGKTG